MERFWLPAAYGVVLIAGIALGRALRPDAASGLEDSLPMSTHRSPAPSSRTGDLPAWSPSGDTIDVLVALPADQLYGRLARWLMDASAEEISAFHSACGEPPRLETKVCQLLFLAWTRLDPEAALSAAKGSENEDLVWQAWACHDPAAATSRAQDEGQLAAVGKGVGLYRPGWLRAHAAKLSDKVLQGAASGIASHPSEHPEEDLNLVRKITEGRWATDGLFHHFLMDDPWAARRWLGEQGFSTDFEEGYYWTAFQDSLDSLPPELAEDLVASLPDGARKRIAEQTLFERRLEADPEAVLRELESASDSMAPVTLALRRAAAGMHLVESDPERAFGLAEEMFRYPDKDPARFGEQHGTSANEVAEVIDSFVSRLMRTDPERTMDLLMPDTARGARSFDHAAYDWAGLEPEAMAHWLESVDNREVRDLNAQHVLRSMADVGRHQQAVEWALGLEDEAPVSDPAATAILSWTTHDPEAARAWLEANDPPTEVRKQFESTLGPR